MTTAILYRSDSEKIVGLIADTQINHDGRKSTGTKMWTGGSGVTTAHIKIK